MPQVIREGDASFAFEGILGSPVTHIANLNQHAQAFLPYNPTIVEVGAHEGAGTVALATTYPYARIFACEPNPRAFAALDERVRAFPHVCPVNLAFGTSNGRATLYLGALDDGRLASLLPPRRRPDDSPEPAAVSVSSMRLGDWCTEQGLGRIDFLRLDAGGFEFQILQRAPHVLETALVIVTRTHFYKSSTSVISYNTLKMFLEMAGFELLSHWYQEGLHGEATFIRRALYDSVYR